MTSEAPAPTPVGAPRCLLCKPPEVIEDGDLFGHLRLFHPGWDDPGPPVPDNPAQPFAHRVMTAADLGEHGALCIDCGREFAIGDPYVSRLTGFIGDSPLTEVVCVPCGESGAR